MIERKKIMLVENHKIVRQGFRRILEDKGFEIVGEADNGRDAVLLAAELKPDIVIMDINLPKLRGIEATRRIKREISGIGIVMLTIHSDEKYIYESLDAGASAYLVKETPWEELIEAIEAVLRGDVYISSNFPPDVMDNYERMRKSGKKPDDFSRLTKREKEILQYIAEGYTSQKIGEELYISKKTVENHRANIMNKLDLHDTASLVMYAVRIGLVDST